MKLPLLEYVKELINGKPFEHVTVIACQHLLYTNYAMFEKLFALGLRPENTFLIGKSYSMNTDIEQLFRKKNVHVHSYQYDSYQSFDTQFASASKKFLERIVHTGEKILVIDDGAALLENVQQYGSVVCGVEQTSSGYNQLANLDMPFPLINVARSPVKLVHESPFIAGLAIEKLQKYLTQYNSQSALVIGAGPIGLHIYEQLPVKKKLLYDIASSAKSLPELLSESDLIIGCTGTTSVPKELHATIKKGAVLVSVSSSDREFDAVHLRIKNPQNCSPHRDFYVDGLHLLNAGFPITFDGGVHAAKPEKIQLTQALMLLGCYQAITATTKGILDLDKDMSGQILEQYLRIAL
ncbi:hypothetical protein C4573_00475 [Candidatus Woesearchaeota archaeon]|nr:MAG: hypothetical protein C4573_00475 [Candidatus Woesearchaeota archaeon]